MILLITGLLLFLGPHLLREFGLRDRLLAAAPSQGVYRACYSLLALAGIVLIAFGKGKAGFYMMWEPMFELRYISHILMLPACILLVAGNTPTSHMRKQLRNPMLLGVTLWGLAHLWANGDLASMLLFGSFTLWAGFKFVALGLEKGAVNGSAAIVWDIVSVIGGLVLYAFIGIYHGPLFGIGLSFA